jgi:hypothetical protein
MLACRFSLPGRAKLENRNYTEPELEILETENLEAKANIQIKIDHTGWKETEGRSNETRNWSKYTDTYTDNRSIE